MMNEISLNILDVAENSTRAKAKNVEIRVLADTEKNDLVVIIKDDGCGMSEEQVSHVTDPFFTTRTTRKVGLGIPFFKMAAELTGGSFRIESKIGVGTEVEAIFKLNSVDRMPLGDINATIYMLISYHEDTNFNYEYKINEQSFVLDTVELRNIIGYVSFQEPEISQFIKGYLEENKLEVDKGTEIEI